MPLSALAARASDPEERRELLLRASPVLALMLLGFAVIDLFRQTIGVALAEIVFALGLGWTAWVLARKGTEAIEQAELVAIASSLPVFFSCLIDPGVGHAAIAGVPLGPVAWYAMGGSWLGRLASIVFFGGWALLALARALGASPFGPWLESWADWGGMLAITLLSAMIMDWREREAEARRAGFLAEEASMRTFLERIPVAVGVVREGAWLFCNPAMHKLCGGCSVSIADAIGEDAWLALLRHGELQTDWETEEGPRPVHLIAVQGRWGQHDAWMVIAVDETETRELERLRREEMLAALAGGVAHHFNNLLMSVMGAADLVLTSRDIQEARAHAREIARAAARGAEISRALVAFARTRPKRTEPIQPELFLARHAPVLELLAPEEGRVIVETEENLPAIAADRRDLEEMLLRLVHNAAEASPRGSIVRVGCTRMDIHDLAGWLGAGTPGEFVVFSVSNRGRMGTTTLKRVFTPFYSTRGPRRAGLGLNVVMGIARRHGALVRVESSREKEEVEVCVAFPSARLARSRRPRQSA